jgi:hypothetical protein
MDRIFLVCGARRTGTTLLAAVLSADPSAPPLPGEAQLLPEWLASYRWAREQFAIRALPFFKDDSEFRAFYRELVGHFVDHCRNRFGKDAALVLKSPELSLFFDEAYELFPEARFLVTVRDPRDQVASEWRVIEKRRGHPMDQRILDERDFEMLARQYVRYYEPVLRVLGRSEDRIYLQRYEQLVGRPAEAVAALEKFTGLVLSGFDPSADWPRVAGTYWAYGTSPSDTPYYGKAIEPRRIGSYLESMSEDEARVVIDLCSDTSARLAGR